MRRTITGGSGGGAVGCGVAGTGSGVGGGEIVATGSTTALAAASGGAACQVGQASAAQTPIVARTVQRMISSFDPKYFISHSFHP
jgi:hypothetical protein